MPRKGIKRKFSHGAKGVFDLELLDDLYYTSVENFGAVGDGVTDDTQAIQDTINAVGAKGQGTVFIPDGTYKITSTLTVNSGNITIIGGGAGGHITIEHPILNFTNLSSGYAFEIDTNRIMLAGFKIDGNGNSNADGGIRLTENGYHSKINVSIANFTKSGARGIKIETWFNEIYGSDIAHIENGVGIEIGKGGISSTTNSIRKCYIHYCDTCLYIRGTVQGAQVEETVFESSIIAIAALESDPLFVRGCYFENLSYSGQTSNIVTKYGSSDYVDSPVFVDFDDSRIFLQDCSFAYINNAITSKRWFGTRGLTKIILQNCKISDYGSSLIKREGGQVLEYETPTLSDETKHFFNQEPSNFNDNSPELITDGIDDLWGIDVGTEMNFGTNDFAYEILFQRTGVSSAEYAQIIAPEKAGADPDKSAYIRRTSSAWRANMKDSATTNTDHMISIDHDDFFTDTLGHLVFGRKNGIAYVILNGWIYGTVDTENADIQNASRFEIGGPAGRTCLRVKSCRIWNRFPNWDDIDYYRHGKPTQYNDWGASQTNIFSSVSSLLPGKKVYLEIAGTDDITINGTLYDNGSSGTDATGGAEIDVTDNDITVTDNGGGSTLKYIGVIIEADPKRFNPIQGHDPHNDYIWFRRIGEPTVIGVEEGHQSIHIEKNISSNATLASAVPAGYEITSIIIEETSGNAVTGDVDIGTTNGGTEIVSSEAVGSNALVSATLIDTIYSLVSHQAVYITSTNWGSATVSVYISLQKKN